MCHHLFIHTNMDSHHEHIHTRQIVVQLSLSLNNLLTHTDAQGKHSSTGPKSDRFNIQDTTLRWSTKGAEVCVCVCVCGGGGGGGDVAAFITSYQKSSGQ